MEWDPEWFRRFIRDALSLADARNSIGVGITVSGTPGQLATLANETLDNSFIVIAANPNLDNERVLAVADGLELTDNGAGLTVVVGILANGIVFANIQQITGPFVGRSSGTGDIEELTSTQATALLNAATTLLQGLVKEATAVADLSQTISDPPTQTEVQDISNKIDELLAVKRTAGQLA